MRKGPKSDFPVAPIDLSGLPLAGAERVICFIESFLRVPRGKGARQPFTVRLWQRELIHGLFDDPRPRQGLIAIPAGNGKTSLAAAFGMYGLVADNVEGAEVVCVASDQRQATILFNIARRMVELNDALEEVVIYKDRLYVPRTDSTFIALPSEAAALEGWNPSLAVIDELHVVRTEVFEALLARAGKREGSLLLAISTPPRNGDRDGIMWSLVQTGRLEEDQSFFFHEYSAPNGCKIDDEEAWAIANPALNDFLYADGLRSNLGKMRESVFRAYRLGQWIDHDDQWLPIEAWTACKAVRDNVTSTDTEVVLALDGSFSGDCTVVVGCTIEPVPHLWIEGIWQAPERAKPDSWRVPVVQVEDCIREACKRYSVREIVCDPFRWTRTMQVLEAEGLPVAEFPQTPARMSPATSQFYEGVMNRAVSHDGDPRMARHVSNCFLREDSRGARITKESKDSRRRIDAAAAGVMAHSRAKHYATSSRGAWILT